MRKVTVNASKKYDILIGGGLLEQAGELIKQAAGGSCAAIITDSNVAPEIQYLRKCIYILVCLSCFKYMSYNSVACCLKA